MRVKFHDNFKKKLLKLPIKIRERFYVRIELFLKDLYDPILNNHAVDKAYPGHRSINITGDYRAIYEPMEDWSYFKNIGTHSELYS